MAERLWHAGLGPALGWRRSAGDADDLVEVLDRHRLRQHLADLVGEAGLGAPGEVLLVVATGGPLGERHDVSRVVLVAAERDYLAAVVFEASGRTWLRIAITSSARSARALRLVTTWVLIWFLLAVLVAGVGSLGIGGFRSRRRRGPGRSWLAGRTWRLGRISPSRAGLQGARAVRPGPGAG